MWVESGRNYKPADLCRQRYSNSTKVPYNLKCNMANRTKDISSISVASCALIEKHFLQFPFLVAQLLLVVSSFADCFITKKCKVDRAPCFLFRHQHHLVFASMPLLENFLIIFISFFMFNFILFILLACVLLASKSNDVQRNQKEIFPDRRSNRRRWKVSTQKLKNVTRNQNWIWI